MATIKTTTNYDQFKHIKGNRPIILAHVKKIKESYNPKRSKLPPILVNEYMEVIDGQHRLEVCKILEIPVDYTVEPGANLATVQDMNANQKPWTTDDFMESYIQKGIKDYEIYKQFKTSYKFTHDICMQLLGDTNPDGKLSNLFCAGRLRIKDIDKAAQNGGKITLVGKYYDGYKRRGFVAALLKCLKNKNFDFDVFLNKLSYQSTKLRDCSKVEQYMELIEQIYNFKNQYKVNLRYAA